jgi:hypothetical protein
MIRFVSSAALFLAALARQRQPQQVDIPSTEQPLQRLGRSHDTAFVIALARLVASHGCRVSDRTGLSLTRLDGNDSLPGLLIGTAL